MDLKREYQINLIRPIIERHAVKHGLTFTAAAVAVSQMPEHWEASIAAQGGYFNPGGLTPYMAKLWRDPEKVAKAAVWDGKGSAKEYKAIAAYLHPSNRIDPKAKERAKAIKLRAKGDTYDAIALQMGISAKTVKRYLGKSL